MAVLAAAPLAAAQPGPRCRGGATPTFTGHPFVPWTCPEDRRTWAPSAEPRFELPDRKAKDRTSFTPFEGAWGGMVYYGGRQFEVHCRLTKKGGGAAIELSTMDYAMHDRRDFTAKLSPKRFEGGGYYHGEVHLAPFSPLEVDVWLGAPSTTTAAGLDHELLAQYEGRQDSHALFLGRDGEDAVRFEYVYDEPGAPRRGASGRLTREKQTKGPTP